MQCPTCLAAAYASDDQLRRLVHFQAVQLDRLTGGTYEAPDFDTEDDEEPDQSPSGVIDPTADLEAVLWHDDIHRKPPRVAAPRLIERLAAAGWHLTQGETA